MTDYIRGKKAYTKWDVDADNVDLDLQQDGQLPRVQTGSFDWFSGTKGKVIKVLFLIFLFLIGFIFGYLIRRGVHEIVLQKQKAKCPSAHSVYTFKEKHAHILQDEISSGNIDKWLKKLTSEVHRAGTEANKKLAEDIKEKWDQYGLDSTKIEKYRVLLSVPSIEHANQVQILDKNGQAVFSASETGDSISSKDTKMRPFLAYSMNTTAKGKLVYANYGRLEDFQMLKVMKISLKDCVVLMRNGNTSLGSKVKLAEENGAVATVIYPDPKDVAKEEIYPNGLGLPGDGIIKGNLKLFPGDPQTPYLPSYEGAFHVPLHSVKLPSIPVQPISYNDAQELMRDLDGPVAPEEWKGKLNISYNIGPGFKSSSKGSEVQVAVHNLLQKKHIYNVIGTIPGKFEPGRYIIIGCHHDSWTKGASDPGSGLAVLMELARAFGKLRKEGWQPGRTIILASWDAEEYGAIGSFEWVQAHRTEIAYRTVAYINLDAAVTGNHSFEATGSPLLRQALTEATSLVPCHEPGHTEMSVYDMWQKRRVHKPNSPKSEAEILAPGSGGDLQSFFQAHGISSIHLQFVGEKFASKTPLHHSAYDDYDAFANYVDPGFVTSQTLAKVIGVITLKLADSLNLPLRADHYSKELSHDYVDFFRKYGNIFKENEIHYDPLEEAIKSFSAACMRYHDNFEAVGKHDLMLSLREYNDKLLELERSLLFPPEYYLPNNNRHIIYGPSAYDSDHGIVFPHLTSAMISTQLNKTAEHIHMVKEQMAFCVNALNSAVHVLESDIHSATKKEL